jgi:gliding motility-associated lipoprotein GldH
LPEPADLSFPFFSPDCLLSFVKTFQLKNLFVSSFIVALIAYSVAGCTTIDLYEKSVVIPDHAWDKNYRPFFDFTIKDTSAAYQLFFILRHNEKYSYNNIYVNVYVQAPGQDSAVKIQKDLELATNESGWKATAMDDIYEHRIELGSPQTLKAGIYKFTVEQIMRENPLQNVLNVGIRIEKQ